MVVLTEARNLETMDIDLKNGFEIVADMNREDAKVAKAVQKELKKIGKAVDLIADCFLKGGRMAYFGAGTSGRLGVLDASECVPTFGVDKNIVCAYIAGGNDALRYSVEKAEDSAQLALEDLSDFKVCKNDVIVGISASGNPAYVVTALQEAHKKGAHTIGISCNPDAALKTVSDIFICPVVGPEVIVGSSRLKAGTAQKMVLNMLSTGAMIRIGKTYQNYMIDVEVSNQKLFERACRFISEICKVDKEEAGIWLEKSGYHVKTACVMKLKNCSCREAEKMLENVGGVLRKVID